MDLSSVVISALLIVGSFMFLIFTVSFLAYKLKQKSPYNVKTGPAVHRNYAEYSNYSGYSNYSN